MMTKDFGKIFDQSIIPEWRDAYVSYKLLKRLIKPYWCVVEKYTLEQEEDEKTPRVSFFNKIFNLKTEAKTKKKDPNMGLFLLISQEEIDKLKYFEEKFEHMIDTEFDKMNCFFQLKLLEIIRYWRKLKHNIKTLEEKTLEKDPLRRQFRGEIKSASLEFYREITYLLNYVSINQEALRKVLKAHREATMGLEICVSKYFKATQLFEDSFCQKHIYQLIKIKQDLEVIFLDTFYRKRGKSRGAGRRELQNIADGRLFGFRETYLYGFFTGFCIVVLVLIITLCKQLNIDLDEDPVFREQFPLFRGAALAILYMWLFACMVYMWTKSNINYRLIFRFNHHYSTFSEIMTRMMGFSAVFLVMFLWYIFRRDSHSSIALALNIIPQEYIPLFVWLSIFMYMLFPSRRYFNGEGRIWFFNVWKKILTFQTLSFPLIFTTDQIVSFVICFKDFDYSVCYYWAKFWGTDFKHCKSTTRFSQNFLPPFIPFSLRIIQCAMMMRKTKQMYGRDFFNLLKFASCVLLVILAYISAHNPHDMLWVYLWIGSATVSMLYCYWWDLKIDWAFLEPKSKRPLLRNTLAYTSAGWYYFAIYANFLLRCSWTFTISPAIMKKNIKPELFYLICGFLEQLRRIIWNLFRVEKEHLANVGEFRAVGDMKLPFEVGNERVSDRHDDNSLIELGAMPRLTLKEQRIVNDLRVSSRKGLLHDNRKESLTQEQRDYIVSMEKKYPGKASKDIFVKKNTKQFENDYLEEEIRLFEMKLVREVDDKVALHEELLRKDINYDFQGHAQQSYNDIRVSVVDFIGEFEHKMGGGTQKESIFRKDPVIKVNMTHQERVHLMESARREFWGLTPSHDEKDRIDNKRRPTVLAAIQEEK